MTDPVFGPGQNIPGTGGINPEPAPTPWLPDVNAMKAKLADRFGRTTEEGVLVTFEQIEVIKGILGI